MLAETSILSGHNRSELFLLLDFKLLWFKSASIFSIYHMANRHSEYSEECVLYFAVHFLLLLLKQREKQFYNYPVVKKTPAHVGGVVLVPGLGISPEEGNGSPFQYTCLGDPMDRGTWWATVHGVVKELYMT